MITVRGNVSSKMAMDAELFSPSMIEQLRTMYGKIKTVDPSQPSYGKLIKLLDGASPEQLKQLSEAGIPFVSKLARNRVR